MSLSDLPDHARHEGERLESAKKLEDSAAAAGVKLAPMIEAEGREAVHEIGGRGGLASYLRLSSDRTNGLYRSRSTAPTCSWRRR
jgi:hypothetical protein